MTSIGTFVGMRRVVGAGRCGWYSVERQPMTSEIDLPSVSKFLNFEVPLMNIYRYKGFQGRRVFEI